MFDIKKPLFEYLSGFRGFLDQTLKSNPTNINQAFSPIC
jgi:hypothetical protein